MASLAAIALVHTHAAVADAPPGPVFRDVAPTAGLAFLHQSGAEGAFRMAEVIGSGVALLDYDGDGDLDVFALQGRSLTATGDGGPAETDRLFRNDLAIGADGKPIVSFVDVTAGSGLTTPAYGMGAATGDYDNDGDVDLYVTRLGPNQLFRNEGGRFTEVTGPAGTGESRWSVAAAFLDIDPDGWLDLYVGNYVDYSVALDDGCAGLDGSLDYCAPLVFEPLSDRLFANRGDGSFEDVSASSGITAAFGRTLGVLGADFDSNGLTDIYVANDMTANQLWMNQGDRRFEESALLAGAAVNWEGLAQASMGIDAADPDRDGDEDLFLTHLKGETNTFYVNDGTGNFQDETPRAGLATPSWSLTGFGTRWIDYDNDGWLDLLVVNGAVKVLPELARLGDPYPLRQPNQLFRNMGDGTFVDVSDTGGDLVAEARVSRGAAFGDVDRDGDTDVVISNSGGPLELLLNELGHASEWIGLELAGPGARDTNVGSRIRVEVADGTTRWARVHTDTGYASAHDPAVLIGLADSQAELVEIRWTSGRTTRVRKPSPRRYALLREVR